jgi:hypothetical protein
MAYAILRIKKLKTVGTIKAVGQHNQRERETLNANPKQPNMTLIGPEIRSLVAPVHEVSEGAASTDKNPESGPMWEAVTARITEVDARIRKNGVLACEVLMSASPEFFRPRGGEAGTWDEARLQAWTPAVLDWLKQEWGEKNVVAAALHLDETTPHIHAVVVPIDPDSGRMNASRWLDGRKALSEMQDRYGESMQAIGLERGVRGSVALHSDIRAWYGHLQQAVPQVPEPVVEVPDMLVRTKSRQDYSQQQQARIQSEQEPAIATLETQARERAIAVTQRREAEATNRRLAKELQAERENRAAREAQLLKENAALMAQRDDYGRQLEQFRKVPLAEAMGWFDPEELAESGLRVGKDAQGRERIFDREQKVVGRNALDLVKEVHGCKDIGKAVAWILVRQGEMAAKQIAFMGAMERISEDIAPACQVVKDPKRGMHEERLELAEEQVAQRKPSTWEGVVAIFKRMQFDISRIREAQGYLYRLWDAICQRKDDPYDPHQKSPTDLLENPTSDIFRQLERQEDARIQREQEEARQRAQQAYRGPRR